MNAVNTPAPKAAPEARRLRDISPQQWKSGIAAWLGWLFDGLDMHIYTLVATAYVAILLNGSVFRSEFARLDANASGTIEVAEWKSSEPLANVDRNKDGVVSRQEYEVFAA